MNHRSFPSSFIDTSQNAEVIDADDASSTKICFDSLGILWTFSICRGSFEAFAAIVSAFQDLRPQWRIKWRCQNLYPLWKEFDAEVVKAMVVPVDTVFNPDHALGISESVLSREEFDEL
jgi:hypothetical protein